MVSVTASVDGRVTLNRGSRVLDDATGRVWGSLHPASAEKMLQARRSEIERRHAPQVVLEGSGTFVADTDGPLMCLPSHGGKAAQLLADFVPHPAGTRWFAVVDGRGRVRWRHKGDADTRLLVLVSRSSRTRRNPSRS